LYFRWFKFAALVLALSLGTIGLASGQALEFDVSDPRRTKTYDRTWKEVALAIVRLHYSDPDRLYSTYASNAEFWASREIEVETRDGWTYRYRFATPNGVHRAPTEVKLMVRLKGKDVSFDRFMFGASWNERQFSRLDEVVNALPRAAVADSAPATDANRPRLGVNVDAVSATSYASLGLSSLEGALVRSVQPGSIAARAGIQPDDVIIYLKSQGISTPADLPHAVVKLEPGDKGSIFVIRKREVLALPITPPADAPTIVGKPMQTGSQATHSCSLLISSVKGIAGSMSGANAAAYASVASQFGMAGLSYLMGCAHPQPSWAKSMNALPVERDYDEALYWFELGEKGGDPTSMHNLAWMHQNGLGVARDPAKAASLYLRVADNASLSPSVRRQSRENLALIPQDIVAAASAQTLQADLPTDRPAATTPVAAPVIPVAPAAPAPVVAEPSVRAPALASASQASPPSGRRRALVIGNDSYQRIAPLINAREDARAIANSLQAMGYEVTLRLDQPEKEFKRTWRTFAGQVQGGDEVVFFYAGHGLQVGAGNYLLPVDISGESEAQVRDDALSLQRILEDLSDRKARATLAIVDACRDNPFKGTGRSIGARGLAPTLAATGQMILFSAGTGQQALDRLGPQDRNRNGLFTRIFLREMNKPNLTADQVARNVRSEVVELARSVGHEQVPAIYDQMVGEFRLRR
jgi:hypothetical protein